MPITGNNIYSFGTPMRFVSSCNNDDLTCNTMDNCYKGIYLDVALMTPQGTGGNPWDNKWTNYPAVERVTGTSAAGAINWYHQGPTCYSFSCGNDFSQGPFPSTVIFPYPFETGPECGGGGGNKVQKIINIASDNIAYTEYPDESRYFDKEFAYLTLAKDTNLRDSLTLLQDFYSTEGQTNIGKFAEADANILNGDLVAALAKLNIIVDENTIEYNKKYVRIIELQNEINGINVFNEQETIELNNIAHQNAWEGGDAVFDARRLLMLEVDDQENNLRIGFQKNVLQGRSLDVFPNPTSGEINFTSEISENTELVILDTYGRKILVKNFNSGKATVENLEEGIYTVELFFNQNLINVHKFIVIK